MTAQARSGHRRLGRGLAGAALAATCGFLVSSAAPAAADGTITWRTANSTATGEQSDPSVAVSRTGYTAVVWEDDRVGSSPSDTASTNAFLRLYRDGDPVFERDVSGGGDGDWRHLQPDVAVRDDGSTIVTWAADPDGNGYYQVRAKTFNAAGTQTGVTTVNETATGQQISPEVAADPDGAGFAVVFTDQRGSDEPTVRISGYASIGSKSYERQVHASGGTNKHADVAMGAAGNAIVVWDQDIDGNGYYQVGLKAFTPSGGVKFPRQSANPLAAGNQTNATVAANFNGDFVVAWATDHNDAAEIGLRSFTANGVGGSDVMRTGGDPQVGIDDQRNVVMYWHRAQDVFVSGFNPDGTVIGRQPATRAVRTAEGRQSQAALGVDPWGRITMTYRDDNDGNGWGQIYLGDGLNNSTW